MLKKFTNKKGFTLMEMLIVVAIIAILIAIAIPTFNNALNKAKVGTDTANIRSGYAALQVEILTQKDGNADGTYGLNDDGSVSEKNKAGNYKAKGVPTEDFKIGNLTVAKWTKAGGGVTYTVAGGEITGIAVANGT